MDTHVYEREVAGTAGDSLSHVTQLIQAPGAVLDVGTGSGALGRYLLAHGWPVVDGITYNQAELERAQAHYRDIWLLDLTQPGALTALGERRYRYIVCADVLEHVTTPETVLAALTTLLADDGEVIISIPNVGYVGVIAELLGGDFLYRNEGLLDSTHLRFFTRSSLLRLLQSADLVARNWHSVVRPLPWSEFGRQYVENLPPSVQRYLCAREDTHAYQFVTLAGRGKTGDVPLETIMQINAPHFLAQVYWTALPVDSAAPVVFDEEHSARAFGVTGVDRQILRFALPQLAAPLGALRIDPADRPGVLRLYAVRLLDEVGAVLWHWQPSLGETLQMQGMMAMPASQDSTDLLFAVFTEDPALMLRPNLPSTACTQHAVMLEIEMSWPQVPEASVLGQSLTQLSQVHIRDEQHIDRLERRVGELESHGQGLEQHVGELEHAKADLLHQTIEYKQALSKLGAQLERENTAMNSVLAEMGRQLEQRDQQLAQQSQVLGDVRLQLAQSEGSLAGVRQSKLWRLGKLFGLTRIPL